MTGNEKAMETLMEQGRAHGKLTTTEINDVMEKLDLDVDQIDSFYDNCQSMNIDIIEDFDAESELALSDLNLQDDLGMALSTEGIAIDDPVKIYLKEIGRVPLLTPEEEIQLAERMAKGDVKAKQRLAEANLRLVVSMPSSVPRSCAYSNTIASSGVLPVRSPIPKSEQFTPQAPYNHAVEELLTAL